MFARMHLGFALAIGAVATLAVAQQPAQNPAPRNPAVQRGAPATQQQPQQQQGNLRQQGQQQRVTANRLPAGEATNNDQMIAQCLAIDNEEEIALAKLAASKSTDRAVRDFADRLIKDHTNFLAELERFGARPIGLDREDNRPQADARPTPEQRTRQDQQGVANVNPAQQQGGLNFIDVKRQMAQMCLANARRELSEEKSGEATMSYIGHQIPAHEKMVVAQKVLRQYASPELQSVLDKGIETAQAHLDQAKQLIHSQARQDRAKDQTRDRDSQ